MIFHPHPSLCINPVPIGALQHYRHSYMNNISNPSKFRMQFFRRHTFHPHPSLRSAILILVNLECIALGAIPTINTTRILSLTFGDQNQNHHQTFSYTKGFYR